MIRHHVLITLHDDAKDTVADQIVNELATYGPTCRTVRTYAVGRDLALAEGTATVAVVAEFDDVEGYQFYAQDPAHVDIIERLIKPNAANLVRANGVLMDLGLAGKRVLVTGGSRGIGRAIVAGFLNEGARVATCARNEGSLLEMADELEGNGELHHQVCDLADPAAVVDFVAWTAATLGGIDIVVSNVSAMNARDFEIGYEVDIRGMHTLIDEAIAHLEHHAGANVVAIGSRAGSIGSILPAYSAYKAATVSYMKSLGIRHAKRGIRFNCVSPGDILFEGGTWADARDHNPAFFEAVLAEKPMQRLGTPEEIANVVVFVASERASFLTGANVLVDGGATGGIQL